MTAAATLTGMDPVALREAMGASLPLSRYAALAPAFNQAMTAAGMTTQRRAAMWCAQVGHESAGLHFMHEIWGPTDQQRKYDRPGTDLARQLGNTHPGDGKLFAGAGPLMITGRDHFGQVSRWAHDRGLVPTPTYFLDHPAELSGDRYGFLAAVWYWTVERPRLNALCDAGDVEGATRAINGGLTHLDDRRGRYQRCLRMGDRILPSGTGPDPAPPAAPRRLHRITVPEEAIEPMRLDATPVPPGFDPNADPRTWPQLVRSIPFDVAGGWLGDCAVTVGFEEVPGRSVDHIGGYIAIASWLLDPPAGGSDVVYRPVSDQLTARGGGAPLIRHWQAPPFVAPPGARGLVINYMAPAGGFVAIGRHPAPV